MFKKNGCNSKTKHVDLFLPQRSCLTILWETFFISPISKIKLLQLNFFSLGLDWFFFLIVYMKVAMNGRRNLVTSWVIWSNLRTTAIHPVLQPKQAIVECRDHIVVQLQSLEVKKSVVRYARYNTIVTCQTTVSYTNALANQGWFASFVLGILIRWGGCKAKLRFKIRSIKRKKSLKISVNRSCTVY